MAHQTLDLRGVAEPEFVIGLVGDESMPEGIFG